MESLKITDVDVSAILGNKGATGQGALVQFVIDVCKRKQSEYSAVVGPPVTFAPASEIDS